MTPGITEQSDSNAPGTDTDATEAALHGQQETNEEPAASSESRAPQSTCKSAPALVAGAPRRGVRGVVRHWFPVNSVRHRLLFGVIIYLLCTIAFFSTAAPNRLREHTPFNHYALLADAWIHGQLHLRSAPPPYAGNNDFAKKGEKWYISFPPFPAVWMLPWVMLGGYVENVRDGQAFMWLAGVGPAVLWLVLEKLRRRGLSERRPATNFMLSMLFALGTVYWFTAVQGTVWFAAHVVAVALGSLILFFSIEAKHPILVGFLLGCTFLTRPPTVLLGLFFAAEAVRVSLRRPMGPEIGNPWKGLGFVLRQLDYGALTKRWVFLALPALMVLALACWHNYARFGDPTHFGHEYLTVAWRSRIEKWGLFSYHYLARNLAVVLASLPFVNKTGTPFQITGHGLALWVTTPVFLWVLWPKRMTWLYGSLMLTTVAVALPDLLYQNSGWMQFGYRFSNDFSLLLVVMLAVGSRRFGAAFYSLAIVGVAVNLFGAISFDRSWLSKFYYNDSSQGVLFQPD